MDISTEKKSLRNVMKDALKQMKEEDVLKSSLDAGRLIVEIPQFMKAFVIMAYIAFGNECDPSFAVETALQNGKQAAYPICLPDHTLAACIPYDKSCFIKNSYGILEPDINRSKRLDPKEIDFIIVPGLAFDRDCRRLGRGAGYYDRFLETSTAYKAGFVHDRQIIERIPCEMHDVVMDAVVSPSGVVYKG